MAPTHGKLEGRITVPTGGWEATIDVGGGAQSATVPAGTYYHSSADSEANDFLAELAAQLSTASGDTVTVTASMGEGGTGKVTIENEDAPVGNTAIVWTDDDLRDVLGFSGNVSGANTYTTTKAARSLWLPGCAYQSPNGDGVGWDETDFRAMESPAGHVFALSSHRKVANAIRWPAVERERTWIANEAVTNESFQRFFRDVLFGEASWSAAPGGPVRWYPDADTDATYYTYKITEGKDHKPPQFKENWVGLFTIDLPRFVEVP